MRRADACAALQLLLPPVCSRLLASATCIIRVALPLANQPSWLSQSLTLSSPREPRLSRAAKEEQCREEEQRKARLEAEILALPPLEFPCAPEPMMSAAGDIDSPAAMALIQAELAGVGCRLLQAEGGDHR